MATDETVGAQALYRRGEGVLRAQFRDQAEAAAAFYRRYVAFVEEHLPSRPARVLDVGCGNAWSTWLFRRAGHDAVGTDLSTAVEAKAVDAALPYAAADAMRLPFADGAFDAVGIYQCLEHVPDPGRAVAEALRVVRPGGRVVVVGPNLLSVAAAGYYAAIELTKALRGRPSRRTAATPRHPYGNTLAESLGAVFHHGAANLRKFAALAARRPPRWWLRAPDTTPPFVADNDACYYCCPMDLLQLARHTPGVRAVRWWSDRRLARWSWPLAGGTWVVLEKS